MRLRRAALVAVATCLLPALAACGSGGDSINAGDVVPARQDRQFIQDKESTLALPIGTLQIHAGAPRDTVAAKDTHELTAQQAPSGLTYLPITWRYDQASTQVYAHFLQTTALPVVTLHSGDAAYHLPMPVPDQGTESFYVLVKKSTAHPSLSVDFDGVSQSVDLTTGKRRSGRAAGLYGLSLRKPKAKKCNGSFTWSKVARATQTCKLTGPILLPYAGGKWAEPGHEWLVLSVRTVLTTYTQAGASLGSAGTYYALGVDGSYRLNGKRPAAVIAGGGTCPDVATGTCGFDNALVFDAAAAHGRPSTLKVVEHYRMQLTQGWAGFNGKKRQTVTETAHLHVPAPGRG